MARPIMVNGSRTNCLILHEVSTPGLAPGFVCVYNAQNCDSSDCPTHVRSLGNRGQVRSGRAGARAGTGMEVTTARACGLWLQVVSGCRLAGGGQGGRARERHSHPKHPLSFADQEGDTGDQHLLGCFGERGQCAL